MNVVDIAIVAVILISLFIGLFRGFIREVLSLCSGIVVLWIAYHFWTVQVGTFSRAENVDRVLAWLNSHGFDARHTKVKTSLGVSTLIWLGPYIQKKTAEKVSMQMKLITDEKVYVTKRSS